MGVVLADLVVDSVLRDGLTAVRSNLVRIEDLFESFTSDYLAPTFGEKTVKEIKDFITSTQIKIVHSFADVPSDNPSFSISLGAPSENTAMASMGDYAGHYLQILPTATPLASFVPISYAAQDGAIVLPAAFDTDTLSGVQVVSDPSGHIYNVLNVGQYDDTHSAIYITPFSTLDNLATISVYASSGYVSYKINQIPINESVLIGCHADSAFRSKILYYLGIYILQFRKMTLIRRGFELPTFTASEFAKDMNMLPEKVFSRFITLSGLTRLRYIASEEMGISEVETAVMVQKDVYPIPDEDLMLLQNTKD